jgi:tRNA nucleotidyltransferase/poly(A) polymerase
MEKRLDFIIDIPNDIREIQSAFKARGFKLFLVGGAVRDAFLGLFPKDYDLATDALPDDVEDIMRSLKLRTLATGKAFGVINVFTEDDEFEIATFREDIGSGRRPDSVTFTTIEGDVKRRDLTINALFYDIETSEIVDLVGGLDDLSQGIIRTVGSAEDRFGEDRLRILRAIRFAARFGSELDEDIVQALKKNSSLEGISTERIRDEFLKGIKSAKSVRGFLKLLLRFKLIPEIFFSGRIILTDIGNSKDPIIVLAQMLNMVDFVSEGFLKEALNARSYTTDEIKGILFLTKLGRMTLKDVVPMKRLQKNSGLSDSQIREFARLEGISGVFIDLFLEFSLSVSGTKVMEETGLKGGPELGKLIEEMELANYVKLTEWEFSE